MSSLGNYAPSYTVFFLIISWNRGHTSSGPDDPLVPHLLLSRCRVSSPSGERRKEQEQRDNRSCKGRGGNTAPRFFYAPKWPATLERGMQPAARILLAHGQRPHLRAEQCFFRGSCPRKKQISTLFRRLRAAELCEAPLLEGACISKRRARRGAPFAYIA